MTVAWREPASRQTAEGAFLRALPVYARTEMLDELRRSDYVPAAQADMANAG